MKEASPDKLPELGGLPHITLRQLEVFRAVCKEESYANAALELRSTRANVKRVCEDFQKVVGRPLFEESADRSQQPTPFARGLLGQMTPLSRSLRRLGESVRGLHEKGRILRFAAAGEFFKGGLFTDLLGRLQISDSFRPCFLRIETKRFRTALLNAECDVYFGVGLSTSDRLDLVDLGPVPWRILPGSSYRGKIPDNPTQLPKGKWWICEAGEGEAASQVLAALHACGAKGGGVLALASGVAPPDDGLLLEHETTARHVAGSGWPGYRFCAILRKHHPYSELLPRLQGASIS